MAISGALSDIDHGPARAPAADLAGVSIEIHHGIEAVEAVWRILEGSGIASPGQSLDIIRCWIAAQRIAPARQFYVVARLNGRPLVLLPLLRSHRYGLRVLSWFPDDHVGCNAPLVDVARLAALDMEERRALWAQVQRALPRTDLMFLRHVPVEFGGHAGLFAGLGEALPVETLYQARFSDWQQADSTQRNRSRRKHDRQQGDRLAALGAVDFEETGNGEGTRAVLDTMFRQRAARFRQMGVRDPFADAAIARFYYGLAAANSPVNVRLHTLRLDGAIVAVRYNIAVGDTLYCLISSMSDDAAVRPGSPGKQCLLRVMQTVFDAGWRCFDMGAGCTDEKRHWCNVLTPLSNVYVALSLRGRVALGLQSRWHRLRAWIKADPHRLALAKRLRAGINRLRGDSAAARVRAASE